MSEKKSRSGRPASREIGNYSKNYDLTISRIVGGFRFSKGISKAIYSVYANYISNKRIISGVTEIEEKYLGLMRELNPIWPKPDPIRDDCMTSEERRKKRDEQRVSKNGQSVLRLVREP